MGTLYENITALCEDAHITGSKMCVDLKLSKSMMTKLKQDPKKTITLDTARKIAKYFGVGVSKILPEDQLISSAIDLQINSMHYGEKEKSAPDAGDGLDISDLELLQAFRDAPDYKKDAIRDLLGLK